jgi:uncharacterized phiE125 gp8 family phage protein
VSEYGLDILTPAATLPVSLAEAKSHLRVTHDDEDLAIQTMIAAATERFERETGMCLLETEWQLVMDAFPKSTRPIRLPKVPLVSVEAVKYVDGNGTADDLGCRSVRGHVDPQAGPDSAGVQRDLAGDQVATGRGAD